MPLPLVVFAAELIVIVHARDEPFPVTLLHRARGDREHAHPVEGEHNQPRHVMAAPRHRRALGRARASAEQTAARLNERLRRTVEEGDVVLHTVLVRSVGPDTHADDGSSRRATGRCCCCETHIRTP